MYCYSFNFLGNVHVISTGPISTVQTQVKDPEASWDNQGRMKTPPTSFNQCSAGH
ncbi:unnamed protein product [Staurois parvus]|uniref:Uncharacterized protein n=1 Tax=Staurois parvus TaxID=386267 RepID=A0ABN9DUT7_9NEOB|nr:unnamed protein product [Staurois parvus]